MAISPETRRFICEHAHEDVRLLALQARKYPEVDMPMAITQIAGKQTMAQKVPSWHGIEGLLYPVHLSLEQCSSEISARYKSTLVQGHSLADLTGGFGIDCAFLSVHFKEVSYIERQEQLCDIAGHNFPLLGLNHIRVYNKDSVDYLKQMPVVDYIFIDPARRNEHGGKTIAVSDCEPDVAALEELLLEKAHTVMIKLSPMLDLSLALQSLPHTAEVHIVSVQNECKELLLIVRRDKVDNVPIHCINFVHNEMQKFSFSQHNESTAPCTYTNEVGIYLYEPNASLLKAGAFKSIASAYELKKLHPNSHLYTSDTLQENFPGRCFEVTGCFSLKDKTLKEGITKANIATRNFPLSPAEIRKRLKLGDGGDCYLFGTTLAEGKKVVVRGRKVTIYSSFANIGSQAGS
ncbi:SAM-dependent methyltransferase [Bacteroides sp. 224]|nr:SAM-dependent methyltransferase [Bacteroides sp. 224]